MRKDCAGKLGRSEVVESGLALCHSKMRKTTPQKGLGSRYILDLVEGNSRSLIFVE